MAKILTLDKIRTENRIKTGRTIDSYVKNVIEPDEFMAFNRIGGILNYKRDGKNIPHLHSFVFLFVERALFEDYTSKKEGEKDKLVIRNPGIDIYGKMSTPTNIYSNSKIVKNTLDEAITHEGIFVLDRKSHNIIHNGLIIPVDFDDLYPAFGVKDDIKLIEKTGYPKSNPPEVGTKSKAMLYFSIYHPEVSFMKFDGDCYIIKQGKVAYLHEGNYFKNPDLSSLLP
ncbi:MAG: hypothetical protein V1663_04125 [archaeon]